MRRFSWAKWAVAVTIALMTSLATPALAASGHAPADFSDKGGASSTSSSEQICDGDSGGNSDTGHGANQNGPYEIDGEGPYDNTCGEAEDPASQNGEGVGKATGRPEAGSVGQADDKNPPGQNPNATDDGDNGYECDGNKGIAKTNPAHTGCSSTTSTTNMAGFASIGTVDCTDNIAEVLLRNDNDLAAGSRDFTVTLDGTSTSYTLAAGAIQTIDLVIPADGQNHSISVASAGMTTLTAIRSIPTDCSSQAGSAQIGSIDCEDNVAEVTLTNANTSGDRTFEVTANGTSTSHVVAPGSSRTVTVEFPKSGQFTKPGTYVVTVTSAGLADVTKILTTPACVLGVNFERRSDVLGAALARTGRDPVDPLVLSLLLLVIGFLLLAVGNRSRPESLTIQGPDFAMGAHRVGADQKAFQEPTLDPGRASP